MPEVADIEEGHSLVFVSDDGAEGKIRRNLLSDFTNIMKNGKIAINLAEGLKLVSVMPVTEADDVAVTTASGQTIRFPVSDLRVFSSRESSGIRAMVYEKGSRIVSACVLPHTDATPIERRVYLAGGTLTEKRERLVDEDGVVTIPDGISMHEDGETIRLVMDEAQMASMKALERHILTISQNGYGKRSSSHDFRVSNRGGKGIVGAGTSAKTGDIATCLVVGEADDLVLSTDGGQTIRTRVAEIRLMGRDTQGVKVFTLGEGQKIVSVARVSNDSEEDAQA
jgi:DNA gyrase subunit A